MKNQYIKWLKELGFYPVNEQVWNSINISHYRKSFQPVPGDTEDQRWHRFFQANSGVVRISWKELEGENERRLVEEAINNY